MSAEARQQIDNRRREAIAMEHIAQRLAERFPTVPADTIASAIHDRYARFEGSRVRDFVPVLVERSVKHELAHAATV